jgi:glycosyltransferase involved in cell wall biosynthesis
MRNPKISVLMPVYNGEKYIFYSIKSILDQSYKNFEFLIANDGSKDETLKIIKEFKKKDKRIKIINNNKNIGLTKSLNKLAKIAKGNFIARMDADDISHIERFSEQINWFKDNPKKILLGTSGIKIDEKGNIVRSLNLKSLCHKKILKKLTFNNFYLHSSTMFKKSLFLKVGGYRRFFKYAQDYDLWCRMSKYGLIGNLNKELVSIRFHSKSLSYKKKKLQSFYAIIASCLNYDNNLNLNSFNKKNFFYKIAKNNNLSKHFRCLKFLYSNDLPMKYNINFFSLTNVEKLYLLTDIKFLIIKILKRKYINAA